MDEQFVAKRFGGMFSAVISTYFKGNKKHIQDENLFTASDLFHLVIRSHGDRELFNISRSAGQARPDVQPDGCGATGFGMKYIIADFPEFNKRFPQQGLAAGKDWGRHWVRPLRIEMIDFGPSAGVKWKVQVKSVFSFTFQDGTKGSAGYIDRVSKRNTLKRLHIFSDHTMVSSDKYPEDKKRHDAYRTLMGLLIIAEQYPHLYKSIGRQKMPSDGKYPVDMFSGATPGSDRSNVINFCDHKPNRLLSSGDTPFFPAKEKKVPAPVKS